MLFFNTLQRRRRHAAAALLSAASSLVAPPVDAQPARLSALLREADAAAFPNRQARAATEAAQAQARLPLQGVLPSLRVEGGMMRTTDPVGAFGTSLRQRSISAAAFDPARLNDPAPANNVVGGVVAELPLLNGDALAGLKTARSAAAASDALASWTTLSTRANVVRAWFGAVLAGELVEVLETEQRAAIAGVRQVESMRREGLVTKSDALQAEVRVGDVTADLLDARNASTRARQQLAVLVGRTGGEMIAVPQALPADSTLIRLAAFDTAGLVANAVSPTFANRDDVRAAQLSVDAATADERRAIATLAPRLNGFARYDYNSPATLYAGRPSWTVGVMGSWSLFGGGRELADLSGARARLRAATVGAVAIETGARVELDAAARDLRVAITRLELAARNQAQSLEASRLVDRRYVGGLATIAERLGAEAAASGASLKHAAARLSLINALVSYRLAIGADPGALAELDVTSPPRGASR